ncbi:MAG: class II aldolase/adducin family protein [Candidatus Omnitrophica bacterium]|nr:class II aldolase/adducin family protein [Candidatus Omnitrophota bacterium]
MGYEGVKFKTVMLGKEAPDDPRIKELAHWCGESHRNGFAPSYDGGSYGNLSFRIKGGSSEFIITGSKIGLKNKLGPESFVKVTSVDMDKRVVYACGAKEPSSESMLHYAIYERRKNVNVIFHGHSEQMLCSAARAGFPETEKEEPYGTVGLVRSLLDISDKGDFLIMKGHGFIAMAVNMEEAWLRVIEARNKCRTTK